MNFGTSFARTDRERVDYGEIKVTALWSKAGLWTSSYLPARCVKADNSFRTFYAFHKTFLETHIKCII